MKAAIMDASSQNDALTLDEAPLISVVMPVYNAEHTLAVSLDSLLAQSERRFEIVIVDDGSTDGSLCVANKYQKRDRRIRVAACEHSGLAPSLNTGIALARGTWIARMDGDDIALPFRFERQLEWMQKTGVDLSGSWAKCFGAWHRRVYKPYVSGDAIRIDMLFKSPFVHPTVMMRTSLAKRLSYDPKCATEDYDLWVRASQSGCKMNNCPEVLLLHRTHRMQYTSIHSLAVHRSEAEVRARYWLTMVKQFGLPERGVHEMLKLIAIDPSVDLDMTGEVIALLLKQTSGESHKALFDHALRLYLKVAVDHPNIVEQWRHLSSNSGLAGSAMEEAKLRLARVLKVREGGFVYRLVKRVVLQLRS